MHLRAFLLILLSAAAGPEAYGEMQIRPSLESSDPASQAASISISNSPTSHTSFPSPAALSGISNSASPHPAMKVRAGFRLELAASDPLISNPVAMSFDAQGRLYVAEQQAGIARGRISLLQDADGDGTFETGNVFADALEDPSAVICYSGGVFVAARSQILFLSDANGDGVADLRHEVFGGFDTNRSRISHFTWGMDNRIHAAVDNLDAEIVCLAMPSVSSLRLHGSDFSFNPRTLEMGSEAGGNHNSISFDNAGRRLAGSATQPLRLSVADPVQAAHNPLFVWPFLCVDLAPVNARAFVLDPPAPLIASTDGTTTASTNENERPRPARRLAVPFAGASSQIVYRGGAFPPEYVNSVFIADPQLRLVCRWRLRESGVIPTMERPSTEATSEFLASASRDFRPVQIVSGPDGTLYIADMARENLDQAGNRGRIWRIAPSGIKTAPTRRLDALESTNLVMLLGSSNGWIRDTASRLLIERRDTNAIPLLARQVVRSVEPLARLASLHTLHSLDALTEPLTTAAMRDTDETVRSHAVQLAGEFIFSNGVSDTMWRHLAATASDRSARVRLQAGMTLRLIQRPDSVLMMASMIRNAPDNRILHMAVLTASAGRAGELFMLLLEDTRFASTPAGWDFLCQLALMSGQERAEGMDEVLEAIKRSILGAPDAMILARHLGEGQYLSGRTFATTAPQQTWRAFATQALDLGTPANPLALRIEAVRFLGVSGLNPEEVSDWMLALLVPGEPQSLQIATINALARFQNAGITGALMQRWPRLPPVSQSEIIARLIEHPDGVRALLGALAENRIPRLSLSSAQANYLRNHRDSKTAARATELLGQSAQRGRIRESSGVSTLKGSVTRGRDLFIARCFGCHRKDGVGRGFGPDLDDSAARTRQSLLNDILEPDNAIHPGYRTHAIQRTNNELLFALTRTAAANALEIRLPGASPLLLPTAQVREILVQKWSLMPEAAAAGLSPAALSDLLEYLTQTPSQR